MNSDDTYLTPHIFTRHKLHLHALLLENQPWFSARDLGRLLRLFLDERALRKLDPDQHQNLQTLIHGTVENTLLISESGVYALLVYHYCPEYRGLREWLTHDVVPALRDAQQPTSTERPILSLLNWPQMSLSLLHWNNQPWIRLQDVPQLLPNEERPRSTVNAPWWKRASRVLQSFFKYPKLNHARFRLCADRRSIAGLARTRAWFSGKWKASWQGQGLHLSPASQGRSLRPRPLSTN